MDLCEEVGETGIKVDSLISSKVNARILVEFTEMQKSGGRVNPKLKD